VAPCEVICHGINAEDSYDRVIQFKGRVRVLDNLKSSRYYALHLACEVTLCLSVRLAHIQLSQTRRSHLSKVSLSFKVNKLLLPRLS